MVRMTMRFTARADETELKRMGGCVRKQLGSREYEETTTTTCAERRGGRAITNADHESVEQRAI